MNPLALPTILSSDFTPLLPAIVLSGAAIILLLSEVFLSSSASRGYQAILTVAASVLGGWLALDNVLESAHGVFGAQASFAALDPFSSFVTFVICVGLGLAALLATSFLHQRNAERGEFYALMCFAAAGMSLLTVATELITLFISLELLSVATYALAAYLRRGRRPSEAGFKYFILGAFSSGLLIYGIALLYGVTGSTKLAEMSGPLHQAIASGRDTALTYVGIALVAAGFAFKVAAVPFHMWTPDVYEGAPTPVTALMSAGVKAAAFAALVRIFLVLGGQGDAHLPLMLFTVLALLTMVGGNLLALPQRNVKRMLAYSSIAHAGYVLVGVAALFAQPSTAISGLHLFQNTQLPGGAAELTGDALRGIAFYLLGYTVTVVGAFGTVAALERREDEDGGFGWDLDRFSGLVTRRPGWAIAMTVFMLSLGGIPPTVGFMAKLLIFRSAVNAGLVGLAVVGVITSAIGIYYYLRVVVYMFMRPAPEGVLAPERQLGTDLALWISTVAVMWLGIVPNSLSTWLERSAGLFNGR